MNKVTVVNKDILNVMQTIQPQQKHPRPRKSSSGPLLNGINTQNGKTPHQLFKIAVRQSTMNGFFARSIRMKTMDCQQSGVTFSRNNYYIENHQHSQRKLTNRRVSREMPVTSESARKIIKARIQRLQSKPDILPLKKTIDEAITQIEESRELTKARMNRKYNKYNYNKFAKFWTPSVQGLTQTGFRVAKG